MPIKPPPADKDRRLQGFVCQTFFNGRTSQSCLHLYLEAIMKPYVSLKSTPLHPLTSIDPVQQSVFPHCSEKMVGIINHQVNNSYRVATSLTCAGLNVCCSSQTAAGILSCPDVEWPFVFPAARVHFHQVPFRFFFKATNPEPSLTLFVPLLLHFIYKTIEFSLYAATHTVRKPMVPFFFCAFSRLLWQMWFRRTEHEGV